MCHARVRHPPRSRADGIAKAPNHEADSHPDRIKPGWWRGRELAARRKNRRSARNREDSNLKAWSAHVELAMTTAVFLPNELARLTAARPASPVTSGQSPGDFGPDGRNPVNQRQGWQGRGGLRSLCGPASELIPAPQAPRPLRHPGLTQHSQAHGCFRASTFYF